MTVFGDSAFEEVLALLSHFSRVRLSVTLWTMACQAPLSMGFSRQEYWSGLPFPSPVIKYEVSEVKSLSHVRLSATPWTMASQALCPWDSPGKNTAVGCHVLLQGIFPTQGLNPCLLHLLLCRWILYCLSHQGSPE